MSVSIVASRYAKSLIELAKEQNVLEAVYQDMLLFKDTADKNRGLMLALKSPVVRHEKKLGILKALFEARVNPVSYAIFTIITKKNRRQFSTRSLMNSLRPTTCSRESRMRPWQLPPSLQTNFVNSLLTLLLLQPEKRCSSPRRSILLSWVGMC